MKPFFKFIVIISVIPLLVALYFFDNIKGYWRFKQYCEKEGGLRIYEPLEKNVGWLAKDKYDARVVAQLSNVGFVRYTDKKDGKTYDLRYIGGDPQMDVSFERLPKDESHSVVYRWEYVDHSLPNELRLMRAGYEIFSVDKNRISARYYFFGYSKFDRSRTILDMPSGVSCFNEIVNNAKGIPRSLSELNKIFKN